MAWTAALLELYAPKTFVALKKRRGGRLGWGDCTAKGIGHDAGNGTDGDDGSFRSNHKLGKNLSSANNAPYIDIIHPLCLLNINIQNRNRVSYNQLRHINAKRGERPCPAL